MTDNVVYEVKDKAKKLERWVRNTLSGASDIEIKVKEATNNDKWGPTGKQMQEIAGATHNFEYFDPIMKTLWVRLNDNGKYWRHVYKGLLLLEYLIKNGSEQVVRACHSNIRSVQTLTKFQYITPKGKDEGENIRNRAKLIVELLGDDGRIREERKKAAETRKRFGQTISSEAASYGGGSSGSYGGGGGGYNDDYDTPSYGSRPRYQDEKPSSSSYSSNERKPYSSNDNNNKYEDDYEDEYQKPAEKKSTEKKPRPPSTELKNNTNNTATTAKPSASLIELFDTPSSQNTFNNNPNAVNPLFLQQQNQFQQNPQMGFQNQQGFQQPITGFGQFQGANQTPTTGFGQFQGANQTPSTGFGGFQGASSPTNSSGFGGFQGSQQQTPNNFGQFQSPSSSLDFDAFNPRGNTSSPSSNNNNNNSAFANFDNPSSTTHQEKKPAFEGSHLVNLANLIEDPNSKQTSSQEKKTLGQALQQKNTNKPLMQGGLLNPTTNTTPIVSPLVNPVNPLINPVANQNPLLMNTTIPQNLTPQQIQQLQLQYQMQLLALQQQQLQGGRGF